MTSTLRRSRRDLAVLAAVIALLALVPLAVDGQLLSIAVRVLLFALLGAAWNVMGGFAGQFSFGHAAYFGIGAYTTAVLLTGPGWSPWIGAIVGAVLAAGYGALAGWLSFRYRLEGAYFALATFAFAEMLRLFVARFEPLNAAVGYRVPLRSGSSLGMLQFPAGSSAYYYVALGLLALTTAIVIIALKTRAGLFVLATRENEEAAEAAGVHTTRHKVLAVSASAALTAVGGAFYLMFYFFIDPQIAFGPQLSVEILLPAVIGGVGTIWGPVVGSAILIGLAEASAALVRNPPAALAFVEGRAGVDLIVYAILLIIVIIFLPQGVYGSLRARWGRP